MILCICIIIFLCGIIIFLCGIIIITHDALSSPEEKGTKEQHICSDETKEAKIQRNNYILRMISYNYNYK